jgi:hypothetical protein
MRSPSFFSTYFVERVRARPTAPSAGFSSDELAREDIPESESGSLFAHFIWTETHTHEHFNALRRHLAQRVLSRNYPKGWGYVPPEEEEGD